jgi:hypothetical protein
LPSEDKIPNNPKHEHSHGGDDSHPS